MLFLTMEEGEGLLQGLTEGLLRVSQMYSKASRGVSDRTSLVKE